MNNISTRLHTARLAAVLLALVMIFGAASLICSADGFTYVHDPKLNPSAMKDIVADENAVYGFRPSAEGSLKMYADYDWTDPEIVEQGKQERLKYHQDLESMYWMLLDMRAQDKSAEEIARAVSTKRNELRIEQYKDDPEGLAALKARNLELYGHEEGPLPDELFEKYGSWDTVTSKAFSPNSGMDACVGLYDDYYSLYVALGQVEDDGLGKVVCDAEVITDKLTDEERAAVASALTASADGKELIKAYRIRVEMNGKDYVSDEEITITLPFTDEEAGGFTDIVFYEFKSDGTLSPVEYKSSDGVIAVNVLSGGTYILAGAKKTDDTTAKPDDTTAKPDDTTAKPDDTTAKPDDTTAKAPDTTTAAATAAKSTTANTTAQTTAAKTASPTTGEADAPVKYMIAMFASFAVFTAAVVYIAKKRGSGEQ